MSAADYVSAVSTAGPSLRGRALDAIWDDQLSSQMHSRGKAVAGRECFGSADCDLERGSEDGEHSTADTSIARCAGERAAVLSAGVTILRGPRRISVLLARTAGIGRFGWHTFRARCVSTKWM